MTDHPGSKFYHALDFLIRDGLDYIVLVLCEEKEASAGASIVGG